MAINMVEIDNLSDDVLSAQLKRYVNSMNKMDTGLASFLDIAIASGIKRLVNEKNFKRLNAIVNSIESEITSIKRNAIITRLADYIGASGIIEYSKKHKCFFADVKQLDIWAASYRPQDKSFFQWIKDNKAEKKRTPLTLNGARDRLADIAINAYTSEECIANKTLMDAIAIIDNYLLTSGHKNYTAAKYVLNSQNS